MKNYTKHELMRQGKEQIVVPIWIEALKISIIVGFGILMIIANN